METKHTPGPWTVIKRGERGTYHIPQSKTNEIRNANESGSDGEDVADADARLISAAPELLAALIECEAMLDEVDANSDRTMRIRQAIAKATGASHE